MAMSHNSLSFSGWPTVDVWKSGDERCPQYEDNRNASGTNVRTVACDFNLDDHRAMCYRIIDEFEISDMDELIFPPTNRETRKNLHSTAKCKQMITKSHGKGPLRHTVISKTCQSRKVLERALNKAAAVSSDAVPFAAHAMLECCPSINLHRSGEQFMSQLRLLLMANKLVDSQVELLKLETHREAVQKTNDTLSEFRISPARPMIPPAPGNISESVAMCKQSLPACRMRQQIIHAIDKNRVLLVSGHTGCGKTTQVPQFILEHCRLTGSPCRVVCTQPRRIAAVTVAERVAAERGESVGNTVGYHIRMDKKINPRKTVLHFCTSGVLLRTLAGTNNPNQDSFNQWTHIILDEAHEREKMTDFLLCTLRIAMENHPHLKLLIMSATLGPQIQTFNTYFKQFNIDQIEIPSMLYDVQEFYLEDTLRFTCLSTIYNDYAHETTTTNGVTPVEEEYWDKSPEEELCWNSSPDMIILDDDPQSGPSSSNWSNVQPVENQAPLPEPPLACDTFATSTFNNGNSASLWKEETDPVLRSYYDRNFKIEFIDTVLICELIAYIYANNQTPGAILVFLPGFEDIAHLKDRLEAKYDDARVFTLHSQVVNSDQQDVFKSLPPGMKKIILSTNIAEASVTIDDVKFVIDTGKMKEEICLNCKSLAPENCSISDFLRQCPEPPELSVIDTTLNLLKRIEALDDREELTELGQRLLDLPVSPQLGKVLLHAVVLKCLDPILMLVASISNKDPFSLSPDQNERERICCVRQDLGGESFSDHMALLEVCCKFVHSAEKVCKKYSLSYSAMKMMETIRAQLYCVLVRQDLVDRQRWRECNTNSHLWPVVKAALVAGLYPNVAVADYARDKIRTSTETNVRLHPSVTFRNKLNESKDKNKIVSNRIPSNFMIYNEMNMAAAGWSVSLRGVTCVSAVTLALFAGPSRLSEDRFKYATTATMQKAFNDPGDSVLVLDDAVALKLDMNTCEEVISLRKHYQAMFLEKMMSPNLQPHKSYNDVLDAIVNVLIEGDRQTNLLLPDSGRLPSQREYERIAPPRNMPNFNHTLPAMSLRERDLHLSSDIGVCSPSLSAATQRMSISAFGDNRVESQDYRVSSAFGNNSLVDCGVGATKITKIGVGRGRGQTSNANHNANANAFGATLNGDRANMKCNERRGYTCESAWPSSSSTLSNSRQFPPGGFGRGRGRTNDDSKRASKKVS